MSFESVVLALNPILFWRCKEFPGETTLEDTSVEDNPGTVSVDTVTLGQASPVITDPTARSIYVPDTFANWAAEIPDPLPAELAFTSAFSALLFLRDEGGASGQRFAFSRGGIAGTNQGGQIIYTSGTSSSRVLHASVQLDTGTNYDLGSQFGALDSSRFYMAALTRNSNVARLYQNRQLADERTDLGTGALRSASNQHLRLGGSGNGLAPWGGNVCELILFNYALTASQIEDIYLAAIPGLTARIVFEQRATLFVETQQIVPQDWPFAHNFATAIGGRAVPVREILTYRTLVNQSEPDYRQRAAALPHGPDRDMEYLLTLDNPRQRAWFEAHTFEGGQTFVPPVEADWQWATAASASGTDLVFCDTLYRDYEVGSYVYHRTDDDDPTAWIRYRIKAIADTQIQIHGTLAADIAEGDVISPARQAILDEDSADIESHLADKQSMRLRFAVLETELSTRRVTAYTPDVTYLGLEVYNLTPVRSDFLEPVRFQIQRRQEGSARDYQRAMDTGTPRVIPARVLLTTLEARAEFLGWLEARQGMTVPLWVDLNERDFVVTAKTSTTLTFTKTGYTSELWGHPSRQDVAVKFLDGSVLRRRITNAEDNGDGTETVTVASMGAFDLADVDRVSFLRPCTLGQDSFELVFNRDQPRESAPICQCDFSFLELLTDPT